jgi:hypothetical protein
MFLGPSLPALLFLLLFFRSARAMTNVSDLLQLFPALATMALSRTHDPTSELRQSSETFHAEAMKYIDIILASSNHVGLQGVLLCCHVRLYFFLCRVAGPGADTESIDPPLDFSLQYALFNPGRGSIWYLVGMAMRQCVEFGYHHEAPNAANASPLEVDIKRRLFWITYKVRSQFSISLQR